VTAQQFAYACLDYLGEFSLTLVEYSAAQTAVLRAIVRAGNEAQGRMFKLNPSLFKREAGATVRAVETGTVTVTNGSVTVSATTLTGALAGNTILIEGQTAYNTIRLEGATKKLVLPYTGTTGVHTAVLYGDAVLLDAGLSRPVGPVWLADIRELTPLAGKPAFIGRDRHQNLGTDWNMRPYRVARFPQSRTVGQPECYFADVHTLEAGTGAQVRLFLTPLPDQEYGLRFDAFVRPTLITVADLGTEGTDPGRNFAIPDAADHEMLLPLWLYYWSRSAFFKNAEARKQIAEDYAAAIEVIRAWKVQPSAGGHMVVGGWR
jgi:hypothetical protein